MLTKPAVVPGFYITNSSYAYDSMNNGDGFAKKFDKGDWFKVTITGYDAEDNVTGTRDYYLADLRDEATAYILNDWRYVDLSKLGKVAKIQFDLYSSDNGAYGMNTPGYFCFDNFGAEGTEVLPQNNVVFLSSAGYATYVPKKDVDFTDSKVEAFAVTKSERDGYVHLTPASEVPAGEAVLVKADKGAYVLNAAASAPATLEGNLLVAAETDVIADGSQYILAKEENKEAGFYKATIGSTIAAGKGYLQLNGFNVKTFYFEGDGETSINEELRVKNEESAAAIYNLAGQHISKMQKGVNIVSGKKIMR